jgi:hypothetical protein
MIPQPTPALPKKKRRWLIWLVLILFMVFVLPVVLTYLFKDALISAVLESMNRRLNTKVQVEKVDLTFWSTFPYVSVELQEVRVLEAGTLARPDSLLLHCQSLYLQVKPLDLFQENPVVRRISVNHGKLNLRFDPNRGNNFSILKEESVQTDSKSTFEIEQLRLNHMQISYSNGTSNPLQLNLIAALFQGAFSQNNYELETELTGNLPYFSDLELELKTRVNINQQKQEHLIDRLTLRFGEMSLAGKGQLNTGDVPEIDVEFQGSNLDLSELNRILVKATSNPVWNEYAGQGQVSLNGRYAGKWLKKKQPELNLNLELKNGQWEYAPSSTVLQNINLKGSAQLNSKNQWTIHVPEFSANIEGQAIQGGMRYSEPEQGALELQLQGELDLQTWKPFINPDPELQLKGKANLQINYKGKSGEWKSAASVEQSSGRIGLREVEITHSGWIHPISNLSANIEIDQSGIRSPELQAQWGESRVTGNLTWVGGLQYALGLDSSLQFTGDLHIGFLNPETWLGNSSGNSSAEPFTWPLNWNHNLNLRIDTLHYKTFRANNLKANLSLQASNLYLRGIQFNALNGECLGQGHWLNTNGTQQISASFSLGNVNVQELFRQFNNFGQSSLIYQNVEGSLFADVSVKSNLKNDLTLDLPSLLVQTSLNLEKGRLKNFEPLKPLATFIDMNELNDIRFATLSNQIEIRNETIYIPEMSIRSNAMDLNLSGTHGFDQTIDYRFNLLMRDLLANKFKIFKSRRQDDYGDIQETESTARIYLKMTGTMDQAKISYDMKKTFQKMGNDMKKEGQSLKELLKEDFGSQKPGENPQEGPGKRPNANQVDKSSDFEFE